MSTKKAKVPVKSKKKTSTDGLRKPSKMKPLKGKKKNWDDDDAEPEITDVDLKGFDSLSDDDDDDDY